MSANTFELGVLYTPTAQYRGGRQIGRSFWCWSERSAIRFQGSLKAVMSESPDVVYRVGRERKRRWRRLPWKWWLVDVCRWEYAGPSPSIPATEGIDRA